CLLHGPWTRERDETSCSFGPNMRGRFILDALPQFHAHGLLRLFQDVAYKTDGTRHHAKTAHDMARKSKLTADRANGTGGIDGQLLARSILGLDLNLLQQAGVRARHTILLGNLEQTRSTWINGFVQVMTKTRDDFLVATIIGNSLSGNRIQIGI